MCCILGGLRKNLRRDEQLESMRTNSSGFAIAVLRDKKLVAHKRSLDKDEIMKIWDEAKDDDYIVTHSRIPSMGGMTANLDDCHLWEREGCLLAHNGTMVNMRAIMKENDKRTDSLVFFEDLFIPVWKSQGKNINTLVENVVKSETSGSRICIITPDGEVHYYGDWVKDHDCMMSNRSYKVYSTSYRGKYSYLSDGYDDCFDYSGIYEGKKEPAGKDDKPGTDEPMFDGTVLDEAVGTDMIVRYMIIHHVVSNLVSSVSVAIDEYADGYDTSAFDYDEIHDTVASLMSLDGTIALGEFFKNDLPQLIDDPVMTSREVESLVAEFSSLCEAEFCPMLRHGQKIEDDETRAAMRKAFTRAVTKDVSVARMLGTKFDGAARTLDEFIVSWKNNDAVESAKACPVRRRLEDLVLEEPACPDDSKADKASRDNAVKNLSRLFKEFCITKGGTKK